MPEHVQAQQRAYWDEFLSYLDGSDQNGEEAVAEPTISWGEQQALENANREIAALRQKLRRREEAEPSNDRWLLVATVAGSFGSLALGLVIGSAYF